MNASTERVTGRTEVEREGRTFIIEMRPSGITIRRKRALKKNARKLAPTDLVEVSHGQTLLHL